MQARLNLAPLVARAGARAEQAIRKVAIDLFTRVIMRSPVKSGHFRGNWQVAIGAVPVGALALHDKTGTATIARATATAMRLRAGQTIYLVNNLPYARRLEYGWSKQAPAGMSSPTR
jgi:hypothetical protein